MLPPCLHPLPPLIGGCLFSACRIPLTKFPSMRRVLNEVGSEIPDMNALTQLLKFKLGFADLAEPTPEILKNYMDVSNPSLTTTPPLWQTLAQF